jgi:hypothetical protein
MSRNVLAAMFIGVSLYGCASSCDGHDDPQAQPTPAATDTPSHPASTRSRVNLGPAQQIGRYSDMADK